MEGNQWDFNERFYAVVLETLIFTVFFSKKRHLVKFDDMGPHLNLFQY